MDIMTSAGLAAGIIVITAMIFMGGDLHMFISEHAMIIIFGGSFSATMIRFPLSSLMHGLPLGAKFAFTMSRLTAHDLVEGDDVAGRSGLFFNGMNEARANPQAYDAEARKRLRALSLKLVGLSG